ncbi:peptidylprolyl isomerase [Photobacterium leiognathi]|uniref:peptidylprolyl isomerase n=1 Tax=Photobacterium leiognathi TaxID=553611 RepID=UPI0029814826|nr:peptidylprolyl isomerase [Photobacterium leiognathi]
MPRFLLALCLLIALPVSAATKVLVTTNLGDFTIQLNDENAPITSKNFLRYVEEGSYNGTIFHRVIPGFMAQGGGFDKDMNRRPTHAPIKNEATNGLKNDTATVAMARTQDPNSATNQFFINYKDNSFLNAAGNNPGYAVFGKVINGFNVVEDMAKIPTGSSPATGMQDVPQKPIIIESMKVVK